LVRARPRKAVADVLADGAREQHGLLAHEANLRTQVDEVHRPHVSAAEAHAAALDVVEPEEERHGRGFAATRLADEGHRLARLDAQSQSIVDGAVRPARVRKRDGVELDGAVRLCRRLGAASGGHFVGAVGLVRRRVLPRPVDDFKDASTLALRELERGEARQSLQERQAAKQDTKERRHDLAARDALFAIRRLHIVPNDTVVAALVQLHVAPDQVRPVPQAERPRAVEHHGHGAAVDAVGHRQINRPLRRVLGARGKFGVHAPLRAKRGDSPYVC